MIAARELAECVRAAQGGSTQAWERLIDEFTPTMKSVLRRYGLSRDDVDDVIQTTWLQAYVNLDRLREPAAVAGWLVTTARRTAMRAHQRTMRETVTAEPIEGSAQNCSSVEDCVVLKLRAAALHSAVDRLPLRQREILHGFLAEPAGSYEDLAAKLGRPVGSIGPTRARSFARLRADAALVDALAA